METLMVWDEKIERLSRDEMTHIQAQRLQATLRYAFEKVEVYRRKFDAAGIQPGDIQAIEDISQLPFTAKNDLRDHFPYGFCAVPRAEIARMHASSGTTGKPTPVFYTRKDLDHWRNCMARNCFTAGVRENDVCQIAFRYTLFTGAFGHHLGVERIGATVIPTSSGQTERQIRMMQDFGTTVLHCTPSYAITIAEKMSQMVVDKQSLSLRLGIHGAESMSEELRRELEDRLGITSLRDYGLTELGGPGISIECPAKAGFHINEDYFYPEIVDPETGQSLPDGQTGELVFTTMQKEAVPIIRYRTRDITHLDRSICDCGRTLIRHGSIKGRTDDMLIIGGVNFFPSQVESVLLDFADIEPQYVIHLTKKGRRDHVRIEVETTQDYWKNASDDSISGFTGKVETRIKDLIGLRMEVKIVAPFCLARSEGKAIRVVDDRK
jgi:phenylacetate-CoA ligase